MYVFRTAEVADYSLWYTAGHGEPLYYDATPVENEILVEWSPQWGKNKM
jgi:hypothetical protein